MVGFLEIASTLSGSRYKTTCRVSLELTKQHQNIRVTCHPVFDTLFPFRCTTIKNTRTDKVVRNHLNVTSIEFARHEKISIEEHYCAKGFSIQRLFQDATRTDKVVRNNLNVTLNEFARHEKN